MFKAKRHVGQDSVAVSFLICFAISALTIILFSVISALILYSLDDPTKNLGAFSLVTMMLSAATSGVISARIKGDGGFQFAILVALAVVLVMLLINVIICAGKVSGGAFMNYGCYLAVAALSAFVGKKGERHRRHKH